MGLEFLNGRPVERDYKIVEKVKPLATQFMEDCRAKGLTLAEYDNLVGLISCDCKELKKEADKKILLSEVI